MDRAVKPRRFQPGVIVLASALLLGGAAGLYGYARYGLVRSVSVSADRLTTAVVRRGMFQDYVPSTGVVAPRVTVFLDSVDGGQVDSVLVEQGAMVKAGQPLVRLNNRRLELEVASSEAQFTQQENGLASLQLAYNQTDLQHQQAVDDADDQIAKLTADINRTRPLVEKGFYPRAGLEDLDRQLAFQKRQRDARETARQNDREGIRQQIAALRVSSDRQKGALVLIRDALANLNVTAPMDGQLTTLNVQPGQALGSGQRIGQIDRIDSFKLIVQADEFYLGRIQAGQAATANLDGLVLPLRVAKIYPDIRNRSFQVDLDFVGAAPPTLRAGQSLELRIELGERPNSLLVDSGAFYDDSGGQWVFVLSKDGKTAERRPVRLGRRNPDMVEVLSGLSVGDRIVTSSTQAYRDAQRLNIGGASPAPSEGKP